MIRYDSHIKDCPSGVDSQRRELFYTVTGAQLMSLTSQEYDRRLRIRSDATA